jgi:SAM-dependent methyltransferase
MDRHHLNMIEKDDREVHDPRERLIVQAKLFWYFLTRPIMSARFKAKLLQARPALKDDEVFKRIDMFLNGDGGMFKKHVYQICDGMFPIKGASVLVPGIGYAQNLLQLAAFRPKEIVAFDLFDYPEEWKMVAEKVQKDFGVPVTFYKGDFDAVPSDRKGSFDVIVSDAVLEHVPDMSNFAASSKEFLKPGGIFYASFGPLWYGPCGDHAEWGPEQLFDHILLSKEEYAKQLKENPVVVSDKDSCDTGFMIEIGLFSYLRAHQYLDDLDKNGFEMIDLRAKISSAALKLLAARPDIGAALDAKGFPAFDRYSGGMYIWAKKP